MRVPPTLLVAVLATGCVQATDPPGSAGIPPAMHGRWALDPGDCAGGAAATGLMVVDATTLRFYESRATLTTPSERTETLLRGTFAFEGEGEEEVWTREEELILEGEDRLVRRESGSDMPAVTIPYTACE